MHRCKYGGMCDHLACCAAPLAINKELAYLDALKREAVEKVFRQTYVDYPIVVFIGGLRFVVTAAGKAELVFE